MPDPVNHDIFEESSYSVFAKIKTGFLGTAYKGKLDLVYYHDDVEVLRDANIDVNKNTVHREYPVPKVKDAADTYALKIVAEYGKAKDKTLVLAKATVWPKQVKLTVKDTEGKAVPHLAFEVDVGGGKKMPGNTDPQGVGNMGLMKAAHALKIKAPWEVLTDKNDPKKREHEIVVRRNMQAVFLKPDITQDCYEEAEDGKPKVDGVRQYVNAPVSAENGCDANGSIIEFEVACKKRPDGQSGDKIYIKVVFSKKSKRTTPTPALLAPALDIKSEDGGKTLTGHVLLTADGGSAKFKLQMGLAGGEKFEVSCGYSKGDPSDDKRIFVTWRKVNYQLRFASVMKPRMTERTRLDKSKYFDIPDAVKDVVKARLAPVFVEYTNIKSHEFTPAVTAPCMVTKGFLRNTAETDLFYVIDEDLVWLGGAPAFDAVADDREITITLCDAALDEGVKNLNPTIKLTQVESLETIDADTSYHYFVKKPFVADQVNLKLATYRWEASIADLSATDRARKPTIAVSAATADYDDWNDFQLAEADAGTGVCTTNFASDTDALSPSDQAAIQAYYEACFDKQDALRKNNGQLKFVLSGASGDAGDTARRAAITAHLQQVHTASAKRLYHPAMNADGTARSGEMSDVAITHTKARELKFVLPKRADPTAEPKAGDFVGAASATTCPVNVTFSVTGAYTYNGHAGGGEQVLVLRNAIPEAIASTVCHELGHSMGVAIMPSTSGTAMPVPPGLPAPTHVDNGGRYYRNKPSGSFTNGFRKRHQGPHCCHGMPSTKLAHQTFSNWSIAAGGSACIMWGEGGAADERKSYCPTCTEYLAARDLRDVRKTWVGSAEG